MKNLKALFSTHKKTVLISCCIALILTLLATGTVFAAEAIAEKNSIGKSAAEIIALRDLGLTEEQVQKERTEFDFENGEYVYDVELTSDDAEYEYRIKASDGTVLAKENKQNNVGTPATGVEQAVTAEQAKSAALADAGISAANATFTKAALDNDDGVAVYDIEFYTSDAEYDYEINALTGAIHSKDKEIRKSTETDIKPEDTQTTQKITAEQAKSAALADAGVSAANATFTKAALDNDDRVAVYDIEFYTSDAEYDYEINALTGAIHSKDKEIRKSTETDIKPEDTQTAQKITVEQAKSAALADAGISAANATFTKASLDNDDGVAVYDIEFYTSDAEYDYEINALTGAIHSKDKEIRKSTETDIKPEDTQTTQKITAEQAKSAALADAGVSAANATFTKASLDNDDGVAVYDIEFYTSDAEYDYEINSLTGAIHSKDKEIRKSTETDIKPGDTTATKTITAEQAKSAALADAGVSAANATFTKASHDNDDVVAVYDIEFYTSDAEYDYEINALTGAIHSKETEKRNQETDKPDTQKVYIGVDAAKAIALSHANLSASDVSFIKAKLEDDDGRYEYEIEFYSGSNEYEYSVDAISGAIIEYDVEEADD